jgi:hypothetical protein
MQLSLFIIRSNTSVVPSSYFYLDLVSATNASLARTQAMATIVEHLFRTISISGASFLEGDNGVTNALFGLTLSSPSAVPVAVQYQTVDGTATSGSDYLSRAGTLIFPAGVTNLTLAVPVLGDTLVESNETFFVLISQPQNAILGVNEATGTILNDDTFPPVSITAMHLLGTNVWLQFPTIQGRFYRIERNDNLASGAWTSISGPVLGTGSAMSVTDPYLSSPAAAFYRLVILP